MVGVSRVTAKSLVIQAIVNFIGAAMYMLGMYVYKVTALRCVLICVRRQLITAMLPLFSTGLIIGNAIGANLPSLFILIVRLFHSVSNRLVLFGWLLTFVAPLVLSLFPTRAFLDTQHLDDMENQFMIEFTKEYQISEAQNNILDMCSNVINLNDQGSVKILISS